MPREGSFTDIGYFTELDPSTNSSTWNTTLITDIDFGTTMSSVSDTPFSSCTSLPFSATYTVKWFNNGVSNDFNTELENDIYFSNIDDLSQNYTTLDYIFDITNVQWTSSNSSITPAPNTSFSLLADTISILPNTTNISQLQTTIIPTFLVGDTITLTYTLNFSEAITTGCNGGFTYSLSNANGTPTVPATPSNSTGIFTGLSDGNYTVSVDYGSNCTVDVTNITVLDNQEFTASVTNFTNPTCIGDTGSIEITAAFPSNAPTDFDYSLDAGATWTASGANPFTIPNLADGIHNIRVRPTGSTTDCNITLAPVTLSDPSVINVAATVTKQITCDADPTLDGATITITPTTSGGNGGAYTYELFDNAAGTGAAVQTGAPFTDIDTSGDYWVVAIDAQNCRSTPVLVNVPVNETITFTATWYFIK